MCGMNLLEIFKAGTHTAMNGETLTFSDADIEAIVEAYDPDVYPAPIVVGHPQTDAPAYGWIQSLNTTDDHKIEAAPEQVDAAFAELVEAGRYKKISASFFGPDVAGNPVPGTYYLKHVGFLGATAPAVKGLKTVANFAQADGVYEFADWDQMNIANLFRRMREFIIDKFSVEDADQVIPPYEINSLTINAAQDDDRGGHKPYFSEPENHGETSMTPEEQAEMDALKAKVSKLEDEAKSKDAQIANFAEAEAKAKDDAMHASNVSFAEGLINEGKLAPADKDEAVAMMDTLGKQQGDVEFGEGDGKTSKSPLQVYKDQLNGKKPVVSFGEHVKPEASGTASFASPEGFTVDSAGLELHNKALTFAEANNVSYDVALTKVQSA